MDEIKDVAGTGALGIAPQILSGEPRTAKTTPPPPEKKLVMPIADERTAREARRRAIVKATSRRGRASTILTERETLG